MIELRWFWDAKNGEVLQYRWRTFSPSDGFGEWSEWQDAVRAG